MWLQTWAIITGNNRLAIYMGSFTGNNSVAIGMGNINWK